jgi:hypothetical protein
VHQDPHAIANDNTHLTGLDCLQTATTASCAGCVVEAVLACVYWQCLMTMSSGPGTTLAVGRWGDWTVTRSSRRTAPICLFPLTCSLLA